MAKIGFVGLGSRGGEIAKCLLDAGHSLTGYNRTKERAAWLIESGMAWANTPRAAAEAGDFVLSIVRDNDALRAVTGGENGIIKDIELALEMGNHLRMSMPVTSFTNEIIARAKEMGLGEKDFYVLFDALANVAGVDRRMA